MKTVSIFEAMSDPGLLGSFFPGETWRSWATVAKALDGLPMSEAEAEFFAQHAGRVPPSAPCRELWIASGRRSGKSRFSSLLGVHAACFRAYALAPGERGVVMLIAADRRQARVLKNYVKGLLSAPVLAGMLERETREAIRLVNGIDIEIHTCSYRSVRGYTAVAVIADEIAFWSSDELGANPDSEVIAALRPSLASTGGLLVALSSPHARRGELWRAWERHFGQEGDAALFWQSATRDMNPLIPEAVIEDAMEADPAVAEAEWGGQFRRDVETFASREGVEAAIEEGCFERGPVKGIRCIAFCDPAGGSGKDSMTLAVAHVEDDVAVLDAIREARPPFDPEAVVESFAETLTAYGVSRVTSDAYAGSWPARIFEKAGVTFETDAEPKSRIYAAFLPILNSGRVELLDHPRLKAQLLALERRTGRGREVIDHPPGGHDDVINAVAGVVVSALSVGPESECQRITRRMREEGRHPVLLF